MCKAPPRNDRAKQGIRKNKPKTPGSKIDTEDLKPLPKKNEREKAPCVEGFGLGDLGLETTEYFVLIGSREEVTGTA